MMVQHGPAHSNGAGACRFTAQYQRQLPERHLVAIGLAAWLRAVVLRIRGPSRRAGHARSRGSKYNDGMVQTNQGALYDPVVDTWTPVPPPTGNQWSMIGDARTALADGEFMMGGHATTQQALFHPGTLSWTIVDSGKVDIDSEEGWTLLQNGDVLTVDCNNPGNLRNSEF